MSDDVRPGVASLANMVADLPCAVCGKQSAHVELVSTGELPTAWAEWDRRRLEPYKRHHDLSQWRFVYDGPASGSGDGHDINVAEAARIAAAFTPPVRACRVHYDAGFYDSAGLCDRCDVPYCREHWRVTASGTGICPLGPYQEPRSTLVTRRLVTPRHRAFEANGAMLRGMPDRARLSIMHGRNVGSKSARREYVSMNDWFSPEACALGLQEARQLYERLSRGDKLPPYNPEGSSSSPAK